MAKLFPSQPRSFAFPKETQRYIRGQKNVTEGTKNDILLKIHPFSKAKKTSRCDRFYPIFPLWPFLFCVFGPFFDRFPFQGASILKSSDRRIRWSEPRERWSVFFLARKWLVHPVKLSLWFKKSFPFLKDKHISFSNWTFFVASFLFLVWKRSVLGCHEACRSRLWCLRWFSNSVFASWEDWRFTQASSFLLTIL